MKGWLAALAFAMQAPAMAASPGAVAGLDHVPIAVRDLDAAAEAFRSIGFTLKPGRAHDNGLKNWHAKFADGTELELITPAMGARDELSSAYVDFLRQGDGPAYLALYAPGTAPVLPSLPDYLFFGPRNASPTDKPAHYLHANGALALTSVWLAGTEAEQEKDVLTQLGAHWTERKVTVPLHATIQSARLGDGEIRIMPAQLQHSPGRRIVGVSVRVSNLAKARAAAGATLLRLNGLWIEFHE